MLNETHIGEIWVLFADYIDKKQLDDVADRYVQLLVDHNVSTRMLHNAAGVDTALDHAISSYIEDDHENEYDGEF